MATSIFDLARQFGGVVENTKPQPEEDSLLSLARQFGGEVVETAPAGVEVEEPVNPEEQRRLGPAGPVGFGVLDLLVAPFAREKDPRLTGVARGAELLGSGLEATARVSDILPEAAPPTTPVISTIKSAAPQLQEWANNLSNWGKQFDSEYATDLGSLTENPANAVPFIIERFIGSLPDMAAATYALPAYIPALANDILNQRLENDGKTIEQATIGDVAAATAAAAIQGPLERFATRRLGEPGGVLGQTAFQAGTEAAQEVTQYAAETAGTQVGFDPEQAGLIGLEAGIVGGGIGAAAGATNTVEQNAIRRNIEERFRRGEDVRSEEELVELDRLREKAFENAKAITTPELPAETDPLQFGVAYSERIYDSIGRYIDANEEFKVEQKTVDGTPRFVVTDRNGTQYGQALESQAQANALSDGLNNTTQERAKVLEQLYPLQRSLKEMMRGYGLNDIGLSLDRRIFTQRGKELKNAEGLFDPVARELFLAVDAIDPNGNLDFAQRRESLRGVLRHEVVHALRYLDLWKKSEWKNLENTVSKLKKPGTDKTYLQVAQENYALRDDGKAESPVIQMEEAVAELIRDVAGNLSKVAGKPRNLSERAINFFDRAKNALTGSGFQTYEDIVRRVEEGIVGSRQRGRIRTLRSTEFQLGERGITPERIQPFFKTPEARNQFRAETAQRMQAETPATSQPAINAIRLNASRESRLTIDPVPPKIKVDDQEFPTRDSEGRLIYSGYEGPEVFGMQTRPTQEGLQNFWRSFKGSKAVDKQGRPQLYLHGTAGDITAFRPKQAGSVFVTKNPAFAEEFGFLSDNYMVSNFPDFMSDQQVLDALDETLASPNAFAPKLYDEMYDARRQARLDVENGKAIRPYALGKFKQVASEGRSSRYLNAIQKRLPSSANVMPVYVNAQKPWDYDNKDDVKAVIKRARDNGADITGTMAEEIRQGNWQTIEGSEGNAPILDAIRELGYDSMYVEEQGEKNLAVFNPNQIKSAIGNNGNFDIITPSIRESRRSPNVVSLMSNEEQPPRKLRGKTQVAQYLQDRALEALGGRVRDLNIEADRDAIADDLVAEALYEMEVQKNALEWYDSTIERTIEMMAIKHPEIKTDPNARTAFLVGLAITSQNLAVPDNLKYSEEVYNHFKKNGRFPEKGFGSKSPSIKRNFEKANMLIEELGSMEAFTDFLQTEFTVGQLNPILKGHLGKGAKVGGELVGAKVYGSSVFGPKIGNGFYTNLRGDFSPVTIDMWFMRTIGRLRGKVMEFDEKKFGKQLARLAKAEGMEGASTDDLVARAQQLAKQHEKDYKLFKDEYKAKIRNKSESTNAAITIVKSLKATRDAPSTGREREQLRDIVNRAINKMRDRTGQDISPAAFQALIWYPEQDLYKKLGVKLKHVRQDYANSTKQFLRREGIDERELKRAEDRVRSRRQRRAEPVRPGAVAPVEAAVTPAGERVSEPVQVAEAVVPRARESRVTGPASVTEPGPDTDIDTTGAAEALNEGQPVNSLGIPVGPLLTYTMPDGTVAPRARESRTGDPIRGAKIDPVMKRLIRSVEFFESAPDKLRGGVGLGDIASRIENYYDTWDARLGEVNNIIRNVTNSMSRSELRSAQDTFERYMTARENNRAQDAADIFRNATPNDRQLISAWESITNITGRVNRDVRGPDGEPIKVWDSKQEKWRPIGTIRDFFPRTLRREVMEVMMNPDLDPLLYDQLLDAVVTSGKAQTRDEAEDFLLRDYFSDEVKSDYFAGVEKARTEALPEIFYDYSWNAATRYLNKWARRTSQIEYFGQELGPFKKDWFDTNIPKIRNRETQDYLNQIKDRIYEVETFGFWNNAMKWGNQLATGLQLGNPASAFLNVVGGDVANIQMYGWREVAKAHASLLLDWRRVQEEGTKLGILNKDYLRITQDGIERDAGKYFATEDKVSVALSKFTDVILTFSGFNGAENIVRATAMLAARGFLDSSLRAINRNPNSNKSKKFIEYVNRENLDLDKLILENGAGPETDKFMRRGVNVPQGSYRIDMTPVFVDTNVGRFFFKYQKFGTQINRFFYRNFFKPWWDDKTDALKFLRLLAFLFPAIFGGEIINQFRRFLGYSGDYGPTYAQISKAFEKDETALGWGLIISRAMQNVTVAGSFGFFGNYYQFGKDVMDQQRVKNPMSPPALSSVDALIDLGYRIYDQGQLTARDFDEIAENTMSFYRANKRLVLASMSELGSEAKEVKRFVAQRDIREIRRYGLRYAQDMEIEGKRQRTSSGPPVRTEMTPTNKAIVDALYQGDSATARTLIKQALKGKNFKEKQKTNQSIRASIRSRQPIQIGGSSPNNQERVAFLKWAKKNLSAEEYQKIVTMDRRYRRAAARVNMGFGDD